MEQTEIAPQEIKELAKILLRQELLGISLLRCPRTYNQLQVQQI